MIKNGVKGGKTMLTEGTRRIMYEMFEANLKFYDAEIKAKVKRIEELKSENDLLKSRIKELEGNKQC